MLAATAACRAPARPLPAARPGSSYLLGRVLLPKRRAPAVRRRGRSAAVRCGLLPVDPWAPGVDSQSIASQLFAVSLFPYLGFLYFMTRSKTAPGLTLFGFYFLLAFVGATTKILVHFRRAEHQSRAAANILEAARQLNVDTAAQFRHHQKVTFTNLYLLGYMPKFITGPRCQMWTCCTGRRNPSSHSPICSSCLG
ncbi:uncharacterized protein LOC123451111 isoform X1 [Hordeum vulgare subsp. vulgare]|uniref:uncharacterized protein LOC123451111 isoform X1 n=1 Tax=Hordeum vulgare subsp. vulgare TaxID=112509 RepID=UPI001D1A3EB1|nr:uncharacterized protein LOC123451111 isoform X1 [Hordeum vulgare subsp. vulgare]